MKKLTLSTITSILLISMFACSTLTTNDRPRTHDSREIYSIFCNYFAEKLTARKIETFVLSERTDFDEHIREIQNNAELRRILLFLPALDMSTFEDLLAENTSSSLIESFTINKRLIILTHEESRDILRTDGWDRFWAQYKSSQGIMTLSRVGYSDNRKQALLYYGNSCGMTCGGGGLAFFQ